MKATVSAKWLVRVPESSTVLVKEGKRVKKGEKIISGIERRLKRENISDLAGKSNLNFGEIFKKWQGKEIKKGEVLWSFGSFFKKQILSPVAGSFISIDEFGNIEVEEDGGVREIFSPVDAVVAKIDKEKIALEFEAVEVVGKGLVDGKVWGECDFRVIKRASDIDCRLKDKVLMFEDLDSVMLIKAEVVDAVAVVVKDKGGDVAGETIDSLLPVLVISEDDWQLLLKKYEGETKQVLVNTAAGRMLVVK